MLTKTTDCIIRLANACDLIGRSSKRRAGATCRRLACILAVGLTLCMINLSCTRDRDAAVDRPNIVFLMADDLGWNDVGFNGSEIPTPVIDGLAAKGVRLNHHYVMPSCTPTRACLLTGRYPIRYGLQHHVILVDSAFGLPLEERTLPEALKEVGYRTAICGKWHLGHHEPAYLPQNRGFDHAYGMYWGRIDYFTHEIDEPLHEPGIGLDWHRNGKPLREEGYSTTLIGQEAVTIVEKHDFSRPLFLYVAFNAPHEPTQAAPEFMDRGKHISDSQRGNYAAVVGAIDAAVGRIVSAIEKRNVGKNTLIIFTSDNGGKLDRGGSNSPLRGSKGKLYEGGIRVPTVAVWPARLGAGTVIEETVHITDWYPTFATLAGFSLQQKFPLDGLNIWPVLSEGKPSPHQEVLLNIDPTRTGMAMRSGDLKLLIRPDSEPELFDIRSDPNERVNLAARHPERVDELKARLDFYAVQAVPPLQTTTTPLEGGIPAVIGEYGK